MVECCCQEEVGVVVRDSRRSRPKFTNGASQRLVGVPGVEGHKGKKLRPKPLGGDPTGGVPRWPSC